MLNGIPCWIVVDYELAKTALTHPALLKDDTPARDTLAAFDYTVRVPGVGIGQNMLTTDPPDHTRLRRLVSSTFTRLRIEALRPRVTQLAAGPADALAAGPKEADLVASYTGLLPVQVISELLGIREVEQGQFRVWTKQALGVPSAEQRQGFARPTSRSRFPSGCTSSAGDSTGPP
jgi:cytochrome P450